MKDNKEDELSRKEKQRLYYKENREKILQQQKEYRVRNAEKLKQKSKEYYKKNRAKRLASAAKWRKENKGRINELKQQWPSNQKEYRQKYNKEHYKKNKEYWRQYYEERKDDLKEYWSEYYNTPRGRYNEYKKNAKKRSLPFQITFDEFLEYWQSPCRYCGAEIETIGLDRVDNDVGYSFDNVVPCCYPCNTKKRTKTLNEWEQIIGKKVKLGRIKDPKSSEN